jgi:Flp pilus assembly pilin Flp
MSMMNWIAGHAGRVRRAVMTLGDDTNGVTMLEYSLIGALITALCVSAVTTMEVEVSDLFTNVTSSIEGHH